MMRQFPPARSDIFLNAKMRNENIDLNTEAVVNVEQDVSSINKGMYKMYINNVTIPTSQIDHFNVEGSEELYYVGTQLNGNMQSVSENNDDDEYIHVPGNIPADAFHYTYMTSNSKSHDWLFHGHKNILNGPLYNDNIKLGTNFFNGSTEAVFRNFNRACVRSYIGALYHNEWGAFDQRDVNTDMYHRRVMNPSNTLSPSINGGYATTLASLETGQIQLGTFVFMPPTEAEFNMVTDWGLVSGILMNIPEMKPTTKIHMEGIYDTNQHISKSVTIYGKIVLQGPEYTDPLTNETKRIKITLCQFNKKNIGGTFKDIIFTDGAFESASHAFMKESVTSSYVQPAQTFQAYHKTPFVGDTWADPLNVPPNGGTWTLFYEFGPDVKHYFDRYISNWEDSNSNTIDSVTYSFDQIFVPENPPAMYVFSNYGKRPTLPPVIGKDDATGKMTMYVQNAWLDGNCDFFVSPRLFHFMRFGNGYFENAQLPEPNNLVSLMKLHVPDMDYSGNATTINKVTDISFRGQMPIHSNVEAIEIDSVGLDLNSERQANETPKSVLESFSIDEQSLEDGTMIYQYSGPQHPAKRFTFQSHGRLENFKLIINVAYKNGVRKRLMIPPGETAKIYVVFEQIRD